MALVVDEEEIWKCRKHPSKRRSSGSGSGVCPICLRDRLLNLCPDCANMRPCACCLTSTSSSSSSSFSLSSSVDVPKSGSGIGVVGRMSHLIDSEPAFRRSRSAAFQFLQRKPTDKDAGAPLPPPGSHRSRLSLWSVFKSNKTKKAEEGKEGKMMRSKSVGISSHSDPGADVRLKGRSWYFPSPMKVFRQQKTTKVVQELSPLCRG